MNITPIIRPPNPQDADAVLSLSKRLAITFIVQPDCFHPIFDKLLTCDWAFFRVAEVQGIVVGYILGFEYPSLIANGPIVWIEELIVDESHRRRGIGRALMDAASAWAESRGCPKIALATSRAGAFYASIGFQESAAYLRKILANPEFKNS